jgi:flavin reductase (DIM6/NTAB) family NADH-FMN oxidoreductase RutF
MSSIAHVEVPASRRTGGAGQPQHRTGIDPVAFRAAFRDHPAGVVVITLDTGTGPVGFTASSLASLSAEPPLVSFGINTRSSSWPHLRDAETAVVHFLSADDEPLARTFATSGIDRFSGVAWERLATGEPLLSHANRWLRIRLQHRIPAGDSRLVVGLVEELSRPDGSSAPLLYRAGGYHRLP